jgi:hypothetical protein
MSTTIAVKKGGEERSHLSHDSLAPLVARDIRSSSNWRTHCYAKADRPPYPLPWTKVAMLAGHLRGDYAADLCLVCGDVDMDHPRNQSETVLEEQAAYAT